MGAENLFNKVLRYALKWLGFIEDYEVTKKEMCENAKSTCNKNCEHCAWNTEDKNDEM